MEAAGAPPEKSSRRPFYDTCSKNNFFYFAIQRIGSEPTAMINNSQPIASIVAAILIFNEGLTLERFFGAIMVIGGILVTQWDDLKSTQNKLP